MLFNAKVLSIAENGGLTTGNTKVIFLHIPKTAGTSIEESLKKTLGNSYGRHYNIRQIQKTLNDDGYGETVDEYKIFTVVRNPFDRIISTWRWWSFHQDGWITRPFQKSTAPFTSFYHYVRMIKSYYDGDFEFTGPDLNKIKVVEDLAPLTQSHIERLDWWLSRDDGTTVECDFLKFENLKNEWERYKEVLNVTRFLPHKNGSSTIPFSKSRSLYNDESHGIVSEIYKDEIERFDYE